MKPALIESLSLAALVAGCIAIGSAQPVREPLPLDVVTSLRSHNSRSPVNLSPDGEWLAHTYGRDETVPRQTAMFARSGFPFAEGNARMQAALTNTRNGQVIRLGGDKGVSWAPVWSPDGQRVAFYADDSGEASLWIWERSSGKSYRFPGVIVRPLFGLETVRWSADSRRILCKIRPDLAENDGNPRYESWQVGVAWGDPAERWLVVAIPGGDVAIWSPPSFKLRGAG
jgi:WD40 repeat protein